jgi:hypothetical protein
MRTVYRVEHPITTFGPYQTTNNKAACQCPDVESVFFVDRTDDHEEGCLGLALTEFADDICASHWDADHPTPHSDGIEEPFLYLDQGYVCGFDDLEALHEWFDGWVPSLIALGFEIIALTVSEEHVAWGRLQVLVDPSRVETREVVAA